MLEIDLYIGFFIAVGMGIGFGIVYLWYVYRSKEEIIRPIFILVRCFPLLALNRN